MFANATPKVDISQRVVATLVACAVVLMSVGIYTTAQAANLVAVSDTLSDSAPSALSGHTIQFEVPAGSSIASGDDITIDFPDFTTVTSVVIGDVEAEVNGTPMTEANFSAVGTLITFDGVTAASGDTVTVAVAAGKITNPAAIQSYQIEVNTLADVGKTRIAIVDTVLVEAVVETQFTFVISGVASSTSINGETTSSSTSATSIDFGTLAAGVPEVLGQKLDVTTNANNGFVVTVESDGDLESANGAVIDNFDQASDVAVPGTAWNAPVADINDPTSWGHWGVTTADSDLGTLGGYYASTDFGANEFIAASTTPREVFHHDGPSDGTTVDKGTTMVAYKVAITALQEAADDYNTTLTYIATPTF